MRRELVLFAALVLGVPGAAWPQAKQSAAEISTACRHAVQAVESYEGKVTVLRPIQPIPKDAEVGTTEGKQQVVLQSFERSWERRTGREMARGRELLIDAGQATYRRFWGAFDGEKLRTYGDSLRQGQIIASSGELSKYWHLDTLLGIGEIARPRRDVADLLNESCVLVDDPEAPASVQVLETTYSENPGTSDEVNYRLRVWVDTAHGFLPAKIQIYLMGPKGGLVQVNSLDKEIVNRQFTQTDEGMWIPVEGVVSLFTAGANYPEGMTADGKIIGDVSKERKQELLSQIRYHPVPFELPTTIQIDTAELRINQPIDPQRFTIVFPDGSLVFDEFTGKSSIIGQVASPMRPPHAERSNWARRILIVANLVAVLIVAIVLWRRRRMTRGEPS